MLASDFEGRHLNEIDFTKTDSEIGGFAAHDFFGDGSFYLLGKDSHWQTILSLRLAS